MGWGPEVKGRDTCSSDMKRQRAYTQAAHASRQEQQPEEMSEGTAGKGDMKGGQEERTGKGASSVSIAARHEDAEDEARAETKPQHGHFRTLRPSSGVVRNLSVGRGS